jgi:hypothetical protein
LEIEKMAKESEGKVKSVLDKENARLVGQLDQKVEFVNEQKENIKIVQRKIEQLQEFVSRMTIAQYKKNVRRKVFYALLSNKRFQEKKRKFQVIEPRMKSKRLKRNIFDSWREICYTKKKKEMGQQLVLSFKVKVFYFIRMRFLSLKKKMKILLKN